MYQQPSNPNYPQQPPYPPSVYQGPPNFQQPGQSHPQQQTDQPPWITPLPSTSLPPAYQPQLPPQRRPRRWPWIVAIVFALLIGYAAGRVPATTDSSSPQATNQTASQSTQPAIQPTQAQPTQPPSNAHHKVGDIVLADEMWQVRIVSAKSATQGDTSFTKPKAGNIFVVVTIEMHNMTTDTLPASSLAQWSFRALDGTKFYQALAGGGLDGKIEGGANAKGQIYFEVPTGTKQFTLSFITSLSDQSLDIWDINV